MANNFKLTGNYYVSIDGNDSNNGTSKDTPKRTLQAGLNLLVEGSSLIVGAGVYNETISRTLSVANAYVYADGVVVVDGYISRTISINNTLATISVGLSFNNIIFKNYRSGIITTTGVSANSPFSFTFTGCTFLNCFLSMSASFTRHQFISCAFINTDLGNYITTRFTYCIFINSTMSSFTAEVFMNCYVHSNVQIRTGATAANFNYNNLQGPIIINTATTVTTNALYQDVYGRYFNPSIATSTGTGTIGDPYGRPYTSGVPFPFAVHRILYSTFNVNSISADPKFNKIEAMDFSLQSDSPHIRAASDGISNIATTKYAIRYPSTGNVLYSNAVSVTDLSFDLNNDYKVTSPATSGEIVAAPIQLGSSLKVVQKISYNGLYEFNKALGAGPVVGNRNVPDNYVFGTGTQGANPDRLVYELRYSTQIGEPMSAGEWDNGGYITAGNYFTMEWNTKPFFAYNIGATLYVGNGDATLDTAVGTTFINATWIQLKIVLRNNYIN